jgi:hypothetical protein
MRKAQCGLSLDIKHDRNNLRTEIERDLGRRAPQRIAITYG